MNKAITGDAKHPMRLVQRRTGLGADLLRAWERRYSAVEPERSAGGQRLYRDSDIDRLLLLKRLTDEGHAISQIAKLDTSALREMLPGSPARSVPDSPIRGAGDSADELARGIEAVRALDHIALESLLRSAFTDLGVVGAVEQRFIPLLRLIGDQWAAGVLTPAHEHLASDVIVRTLHWMRDASVPSEGGPSILFATTQGERHEMGIQAAATIASACGWKVIFLGADLPIESILAVTSDVQPDVVALSLVNSTDSQKRLDDVLAVRSQLPQRTLMMVGGAGAERAREVLVENGIEVQTSTQEFRRRLAELSSAAEMESTS